MKRQINMAALRKAVLTFSCLSLTSPLFAWYTDPDTGALVSESWWYEEEQRWTDDYGYDINGTYTGLHVERGGANLNYNSPGNLQILGDITVAASWDESAGLSIRGSNTTVNVTANGLHLGGSGGYSSLFTNATVAISGSAELAANGALGVWGDSSFFTAESLDATSASVHVYLRGHAAISEPVAFNNSGLAVYSGGVFEAPSLTLRTSSCSMNEMNSRINITGELLVSGEQFSNTEVAIHSAGASLNVGGTFRAQDDVQVSLSNTPYNRPADAAPATLKAAAVELSANTTLEFYGGPTQIDAAHVDNQGRFYSIWAYYYPRFNALLTCTGDLTNRGSGARIEALHGNTLRVMGNFTQDDAATLHLGPVAGSAIPLRVDGRADIQGKLVVDFEQLMTQADLIQFGDASSTIRFSSMAIIGQVAAGAPVFYRVDNKYSLRFSPVDILAPSHIGSAADLSEALPGYGVYSAQETGGVALAEDGGRQVLRMADYGSESALVILRTPLIQMPDTLSLAFSYKFDTDGKLRVLFEDYDGTQTLLRKFIAPASGAGRDSYLDYAEYLPLTEASIYNLSGQWGYLVFELSNPGDPVLNLASLEIAGANVPEPTGATLLLMMSALGLRRRRRAA